MASYTVKSGDTLSAIAKRLGVPMSSITGYRSGNPNLIYPGEVLTVGGSAPAPAPAATPTAAPPTPQTMAEQLIQTSIDKYTKLADQYKSKLSEYDQKNPFVFDTILAQEKGKAAQRLDPYYEQTLSDYLRGTNIQRTRSVEDEKSLLDELGLSGEELSGSAKMQLDNAIEKSRQGYADSGLYGSGQQLRDEGQTVIGATDNASQQKQRIQTGTQRRLEDLSLEEQQKRRDLTREQSYNVENASLAETLRRQKQWEFERGQYAGTPPGTNPQQYEGSLYSLLYG